MFGNVKEYSQYKTNSERAIAKRKMYILGQNWLQGKLRNETHMKHTAEWQNKGLKVQQNKYVKQRLTQLRSEAKQKLNVRKSKLAMLLKGEEDQYIHELQFIELTEEQVRDNMRLKVKTLKKAKEIERQKFVNKQYERQFRDGADALRKIESNLNEIKSMQQREIQMMERQKLLEDKYREEMIYAELYQKQYEQKGLREKEKKAEQRAKVQQRNQILAHQIEQRKQQRIKDQISKQQERDMLNQQWKLDDERHRQRQIEQHYRNLELNRVLQQSNTEQKRFKAELLRKEKQQDKRMINDIVQREKMQDKLDKEKLEKQKEDTRQFLLNFKDRRGETHKMDAIEQKLIDAENEKQWKQRQDVWEAEEKARIQLMYEVYANRDQKLDENAHRRDLDKQEVRNDRSYEDRLFSEFQTEVEERRQRIAKRNKNHQKDLLSQISVKVGKQQQKEERDALAHQKLVEKEQAYDLRIKQALELGKKQLEAQRQTKLY